MNQKTAARLAAGWVCLGAAAVAGTGCGRRVLRLADVSSGDYYTVGEFEHLSDEQRAEYCQDLAEEYAYQADRRQEAEGVRNEALAALSAADRKAKDLREEIGGLASRQPPTPPAAASSHVVRRGETLWGIARRILGAGRKWSDIFDMNQDRITDPDRLRVGTELRIPAGARPGAGGTGS